MLPSLNDFKDGGFLFCLPSTPAMPPEKGLNMNENSWLENGYCHLVNKTFFFIEKYFEGIVPAGRPDQDIYWKTKKIYDELEVLWEEGRTEEADRILGEYLTFATEYFEQGNPWKNREKNPRACRNAVLNSVQMIANLTVWLGARREYPAYHVMRWLELDREWQVHHVHSGYQLPKIEQITPYHVKSTFQMA